MHGPLQACFFFFAPFYLWQQRVCRWKETHLEPAEQTVLISLNNGADARRPGSAQPSSASQRADKSRQTTSSWHPHADQRQKNIFELCSPSEVSWRTLHMVINPREGGISFFSTFPGANFRIRLQWNVTKNEGNHGIKCITEREMSPGFPQQLDCLDFNPEILLIRFTKIQQTVVFKSIL